MKQSDMKGHLAAFVTIFWGTTFYFHQGATEELQPH